MTKYTIETEDSEFMRAMIGLVEFYDDGMSEDLLVFLALTIQAIGVRAKKDEGLFATEDPGYDATILYAECKAFIKTLQAQEFKPSWIVED